MRALQGRHRIAALALMPSMWAAPVAAQTPASVDAATVEAVIEQVATTLERSYVFPDMGIRYGAGLRERAAAYPSGMTPSEFAARVTADLQAIHRDLHLRLTPAPTPARAAAPPGPGASAPAAGRSRVRNGGAAEPPGGQPVAATAEQLFSPFDVDLLPDVARGLFMDESSRNHFFRKVEVLPGNVGYIDYDQFGFPNFSTDAADAAFAFVAETDAIILDLRGNRGGVEGMNQYLASHFFGAEPVHLYSRYYGASRTTLRYYTFPDEVDRRFPERPLFVLVDGATGSAAENLSFALQGLGRATVVGESSAGAAHSSRALGVGRDFVLQLPIARAFNPRTDQDWEGTGVIPDLPVAGAVALEAAHSAAIDQLLASAPSDARVALEDAKLLMAARNSAATLDFDPAEFVGSYGHRRVFFEEDRLRMERTDIEGVAPVNLVALAPDYFTLAEAAAARLRFERDATGQVVRLRVRLPTGAWETGERVGRP